MQTRDCCLSDNALWSAPATPDVAADEADPQVGVGATGAAAAGAGVAAEHAVPAHGAGRVAPVLDALAMKPVVAHLQGRTKDMASSEAADEAAVFCKHPANTLLMLLQCKMPIGRLFHRPTLHQHPHEAVDTPL